MAEATQVSPMINPKDYPTGAIIILPGKNSLKQSKIYKTIRSRQDEGTKEFKEIGNFYIDCIAFGLDTSKNTQYLINLNGELRVIDASFISMLTKLRTFVRPYVWHGTPQDTEALAELIFEKVKSSGEHNLIVIRDYVGLYRSNLTTNVKNEEPKNEKSIEFWVFKDCIVVTKKNNERCHEVIGIPDSGTILLDDLYIVIDQSNINKALIPNYVSQDSQNYSSEEFMADWLSQVKNPTLLYSLLGWMISSIHLELVNSLRKTEFFPFFVITAATESGKTSLLANCIKFFGLSYIGENFAASVTRFVETVEFSRVSHIPIWRDEYKNEKYALEKEGWLRSVYTRSSSSRGDASQNVHQYPTNATLLLTGEDITEDPALSRRMIKMRLKKNEKVSKAEYQALTKKATAHFPKMFPHVLKTPFNTKVFSEIFNDPNNVIDGDTDQQDELMCYASVGAVFGKGEAMKAIKAAQKYHLETKDDVVNQKQVTVDDFFNSVNAIFMERGWYDESYDQKPKALNFFYFPDRQAPRSVGYGDDGNPAVGSKKVYIQFNPLYSIAMKYRSSNDYKWSKRALGQLISEAYDAVSEPRRFDNKNARVMIIEDYDNYADTFGDLMSHIEGIQDEWETPAIDKLPNL